MEHWKCASLSSTASNGVPCGAASWCGRGPGPVGGAVTSPRSWCTLCECQLGHVHGAHVNVGWAVFTVHTV
ncbi:hypothetical protein E2C01_022121 [Portunus trituberculatus]|uniref:Uncharacterized protein n=1 Tax=Portunus trituberculatus TaxID=210409 RepID=A0A5B7E565_PORTR|nr:hypothetical protein [Portunus trituberculatus]